MEIALLLEELQLHLGQTMLLLRGQLGAAAPRGRRAQESQHLDIHHRRPLPWQTRALRRSRQLEWAAGLLPAPGELLALLEVARPRGAVSIHQQLEWVARALGHRLGGQEGAPIGQQLQEPPSR